MSEWKEFRLDRLFAIKGSTTTKLEVLEDKYGVGKYNYVTTSASNNGVDGHYNHFTEHGNVIVVESACMGFATYQATDFSASDHVEILHPKFDLSFGIAMFFVTLLNGENFKFSYGRKCNQVKIRSMVLRLPIQHDTAGQPVIDPSRKYSDDGYVPDWDFMEQYMKSLNTQSLVTQRGGSALPTLGVEKWKEFKVNRIFICETTILSVKDVLDEGSVPFISRTAENNGCDGYVDVSADAITKGHCLTVGAEGIYCFYQPVDFATGNKVYTLRNADLTVGQYLFIATVLNQEDYKYNYGRARIKSKLEDEMLRLPVQHDAAGQPVIDPSRKYSDDGYIPDWAFMEQYIGSLPGGDLI